MILAVDVGNSNTDGRPVQRYRELLFRAPCWRPLPAARPGISAPSSSWASFSSMGRMHGRRGYLSVRRSAADCHLHRCHRPPDRHPPMVVGPGIRTGLNIKAEIHNQLGRTSWPPGGGKDRQYPSPIVMVDMGTATSLSLIVGSVYEGCIIMPGLALALDALSERAAALSGPISIETASLRASWATPQRRPCAPACFYGHASMVTGCWSALRRA